MKTDSLAMFSGQLRRRVEACLDELERDALVRPLADAEIAFQFKNALVQDTVYESLLKNERPRAAHGSGACA